MRRGSEPRLLAPEIAAPSVRLSDAGGAWTYAPRGHEGSDWARGRYYTLTDFALELVGIVALVHTAHGRPVLIEGRGAGSLVAALAALAAPERVRGLILRADDGGWSGMPHRLVTTDSVVNPGWRDAVAAPPPPGISGLDPVLAVGPPRSMPASQLREALTMSRIPWWSDGGTPADPVLPVRLRTTDPPA